MLEGWRYSEGESLPILDPKQILQALLSLANSNPQTTGSRDMSQRSRRSHPRTGEENQGKEALLRVLGGWTP